MYYCTAVKRVIAGPHKRYPELKVIPVELDDVWQIGEVCRTFSVECTPDDIDLPCKLHNCLNQVGVRASEWQWDPANRRIVVIVESAQGRVACM